MRYEKPPISTDDHIRLLRQRGLLIKDEEHATKFIESIGYYRLTGYMYHLQSSDGGHRFHPDTTFDQVIDIYHFDKKTKDAIGGLPRKN